MRGQILVISDEKQAGAIATPDGQRVMFRLADWQDVVPPQRGMEVEFNLDENKRVRQVQLAMLSASPQQHQQQPARSLAQEPKRKAVLTLFALFLGWAGAHRFYMGAWGWGLVQLLALPFFIGLLMALVPAMGLFFYVLMSMFVLVELVRYIWWTDAEFDERVKAYQGNRPGPFSFFW